MKITDKRRTYEEIRVTDIKGGEIFSQDGRFYLKLSADICGYDGLNIIRRERMIDDIATSLDAIDDREDIADIVASHTNSYNAISLETNELIYVCGTAFPVDAELVINRFK